MFIQKIIHVHHSLAETKAVLGRLQNFRPWLEGVNKATMTADGIGQFDCEVSEGVHWHAVVAQLPTEEADSVLFHSTAGNLKLAGLVEFCEVRPGVTEVQLVVQYAPVSFWLRCTEMCTRQFEHYIERQLRALQACLDGTFSHSPSAVSAARFMGQLPQLAR
jgi:hypothetical protein